MPLLVTRTVPVPGIQVAVTHGPSCAGGGGLAQPAIVQGAASVTVGDPPTWTCVFGIVAWAWPPWAHITWALVLTRFPGITSPSGRRC